MSRDATSRHLSDRLVEGLMTVVFDIFVPTVNRLYATKFPHKRKLFVTLALLPILMWLVVATIGSDKSTSMSTARPPANSSVFYQTGPLAGRKAGDLYAAYLGYSGTVIPTELKINWVKQLDALWTRKSNRRGVTPVAKQAHQSLVAEYASLDPGRTNLESYQKVAGEHAKTICAELDWNQVQRMYRLNDREGALLKRVSCNMGGRVLLAYAMAELLPSANGDLNRDYLDFLLQHGGRRYVESLPALHDDITSFGPLQFTHFAVYDADERRGASKVNTALPTQLRIPGSTLRLRGDDHLKAAYLFAVSNLADGIRGLNDRQLRTFEQVAGPRGVDVAQYVATAHNKPAVARQSLRRWLDNGAQSSYLVSCPRVSRLYATKTLKNYQALSPTR